MNIIVISGSIGVGKTSLLHSLRTLSLYSSQRRKFVEENVDAWKFYLEKFYLDPSADSAYMFQKDVEQHFFQLTKDLEQIAESGEAMTVFVERSPADVLSVFLPMNRHLMTKEMYESLRVAMQMYADRPVWKRARYFLVTCPVDETLRRIGRRNRDGESAITREYLDRVGQLYEVMRTTHDAVPLDNTCCDEVQKLASQILATMCLQ